jgi:hypothetical protein
LPPNPPGFDPESGRSRGVAPAPPKEEKKTPPPSAPVEWGQGKSLVQKKAVAPIRIFFFSFTSRPLSQEIEYITNASWRLNSKCDKDGIPNKFRKVTTIKEEEVLYSLYRESYKSNLSLMKMRELP